MKLYDLARMTVSGTPGAGSTINLLAAATGGYLTFAQAQVPDGAKISYGIKDGSSLEVGRATYNSAGPSLSNRAPVLVTGGGQTPLTLTSAAVVSIVALAQDFEEEIPPLSQLLGNTIANVAEVESTKALRATLRALSLDNAFQIGHYATGIEETWTLGAAAAMAGGFFYQCGMGSSPGLAIVRQLQVQMATIAISGARNGNCSISAKQTDFINDTSFVGMVLGVVNNNPQSGSGVGPRCSLRVGQAEPLMNIWAGNSGLNQSSGNRSTIYFAGVTGGCGQAVGNNIPLTNLIDAYGAGGGPLVLGPHQGINLEATAPAAVTSQSIEFMVNLVWDEYIPTLDVMR